MPMTIQDVMDDLIANMPMLALPDRSFLRNVVDRKPSQKAWLYAVERTTRFANAHPGKPPDEIARVLLDILRKKIRKDEHLEVS